MASAWKAHLGRAPIGNFAMAASSASGQLRRSSLLLATIADLGRLNGPAMHVLNLANGLASANFAVTVLAPKPGGPLPITTDPEVRLRALRIGRLWRLPSSAILPGMVLKAGLLGRHDIFYLRSGVGTWPLAAVAKKVMRSRLILEFNGWYSMELASLGYGGRVARAAERMQLWEARIADGIRVVTPELRDLLLDRGIPAERIRTIGNGSDINTFAPLDLGTCRARNGLPASKPLLAVAGNLWPALDLGTVFQALKLLREQGLDAELIVIGDGVSREAFAARAADTLGSPPPVRWFGAVPPSKVNELLNAADVVLAPFSQRIEFAGLAPLKIRDCAAAGKPCVASALGGIERLEQEPWMFLAAAGDPAALAGSVRRALASDPQVMRASARAYAERNFDWKLVSREVAAFVRPFGLAPGTR